MTRPARAYAAAGVDLAFGREAKEGLRAAAESTRTPLVVHGFGAFGGAIRVPPGYAEPVLVTSIDGLGTKLHLAIAWGRARDAGRDLVNHCINDIAVHNARPLAFQDYVASGSLGTAVLVALVEGMAEACRVAGSALVGGETAQMPDTYQPGAYDVAGAIVGIAERSLMPSPAAVMAGDVLVGLPALGLHTNGFSLARRTAERLGPEHRVGDANLADALLAPHPSYLPQLQRAFGVPGTRVAAHITGGGLGENVPRVLPAHLAARITLGAWRVPPVFDTIQGDQGIGDAEMYQVFNMGVGLTIVAAPSASERLLAELPGAFRAGVIVPRRGDGVELAGA